MIDFYEPGKMLSYEKKRRPLTEKERQWTMDRVREWWKDRYCRHCEHGSHYADGIYTCTTSEDDNCPTCASVEALNDGLRFMQLVLEDICAGDEHDLPCSHVPKNLGCPYRSDEYGEKPCDWCNHKERLIRIEEIMDGGK